MSNAAICARTEDRLVLYLIGDLPEVEAAEVARHLRGCPACARERDALRDLVGGLRAQGPAPMPLCTEDERFWQGLREGVLDRLAPPVRRAPRLRGLGLGLAMCAAVAVAVAVLGPWTGRRAGTGEAPAAPAVAAAQPEDVSFDEAVWDEDAIYPDPDPAELVDELDREDLVLLAQQMETGA